MILSLPRRRRSHAQRAVALRRWGILFMLLVYVATAAGVPLPLGGRSISGTGLYPCAGAACGCGSAEQCWSACCCHSLAERLHWARQHSVRPPDLALAAAQEQGLDISWAVPADCSSNEDDCCVAGSPRLDTGRFAECSSAAIPSTSKNACCERELPSSTKAEQQPAEPDQGQTVIIAQALACKGKSVSWLPAIPQLLALRCDVTAAIPLIIWMVPPSAQDLREPELQPPVPPPRFRG